MSAWVGRLGGRSAGQRAGQGATEAIVRGFFDFLMDVPHGMLGFQAISDLGEGLGSRPSWPGSRPSWPRPGRAKVVFRLDETLVLGARLSSVVARNYLGIIPELSLAGRRSKRGPGPTFHTRRGQG